MPFMFDKALIDDNDFVLAWNVAAGETTGFVFDWGSMTFKKA